MIEIKNLKKSYGGLQVLNDINLMVEKGEVYGLVGRSGAGKSTLLRCINGLEQYDEGSLTVNGVEISKLNQSALRQFRKGIGMIFQQFSLLNRMTAYQNIALPMSCWRYPQAEIDRRVRELVELVGIADKLQARPSELSGGQKQRVAIARALTMQPQVLLCDEATSALDPQTAKSIIALLNQINRELGITIVIVTHQMSVLRLACSRISILEGGQIADSGAVEKIFLKQPQSLRNLVGNKEVTLPPSGVNLRILLAQASADQPIITRMARELQTDFLILGGEMESYRHSVLGSVIINLADEHVAAVTAFLTSHRVTWQIIDRVNPQSEGEIASGE